MTTSQALSEVEPTRIGVLEGLRELCAERGLEGLAGNLAVLQEVVGEDLGRLSVELDAIEGEERMAHRAASRLVHSGGKRLRPLCVALASRVGSGFSDRALQLAVAVELVHNATLLHDDVVDLAPTRRGLPSARAEIGNAASIFAGDWLLVEALRRVRKADVADTLDDLLETIAEMIRGESLQLENRGRLRVDRELYFEISQSKSAALFRWGLLAGAKAGGLSDSQCMALAEYGIHLGIAFQVIDDLLDLTGEIERTGKALFADLREGKMTLPLIVALERDPGLRPVLEQIVGSGATDGSFLEGGAFDGATEARDGKSRRKLDPYLRARICSTLEQTGAARDCREIAEGRVAKARASLESLPECAAKAALALVAESTVRRSH